MRRMSLRDFRAQFDGETAQEAGFHLFTLGKCGGTALRHHLAVDRGDYPHPDAPHAEWREWQARKLGELESRKGGTA